MLFLDRMVAGGTFEWKGPGLFSVVHASPPDYTEHVGGYLMHLSAAREQEAANG